LDSMRDIYFAYPFVGGLQETYGSRKTWNSLMEVNEGVSYYLDSRGRYSEAEGLLGNVLASKEKVLDSRHIAVLQTQHRLARAYQMQGRYYETETLYAYVLAGREKHLGVEHSDTLRTMNNLANVYGSQGRHRDAERIHGRILTAQQKHLVSSIPTQF
jgi:tetratricopeptide (TPR) repeat protein